MCVANVIKYVSALSAILLLSACAGSPEPPPSARGAPSEGTEESSISERPAQDDPDGPEPEDLTIDEPARSEEDETASDAYEVSEEVYNRTFTEVEQKIAELNEIIRERDFAAWQEHLTERYIETFSSPERLEELSEMPVLQRNEIELNTLRDYFRWVVVPSRSNARLDDLRFEGEDRVEAIMELRGQRVTLYELRRVDDSWKVDVY